MVLDLIVEDTDDGFTAKIPSLQGCECWAHDEDSVIDKCIELLKFYISLSDTAEIKIDKARKSRTTTIYKLVFNKN